MTSPCQYCSKRYVGCHAECKLYIAYDNENKARREERLHGYVSAEDRGKRIKQQIQRDYRNRRKAKNVRNETR